MMKMIIDENLQKESVKEYRMISHKVSIAPIIIDYRQVKSNFKPKFFKKIVPSSSFLRKEKIVPNGLDIEVNTKLVDKLFHYKEKIKKKKN